MWSILSRDFERDIIPMCRSEKMALLPWGALGSGKFKTEEQIKEYESKGEKTRVFFLGPINEKSIAITKILEKIAKTRNSSITGVALAYVMQKEPYVFPIVGGRKVSHLQENIEALDKVTLTEAEIKELEDASPLDVGFPNIMIGTSSKGYYNNSPSGKYSWVEDSKPITYN